MAAPLYFIPDADPERLQGDPDAQEAVLSAAGVEALVAEAGLVAWLGQRQVTGPDGRLGGWAYCVSGAARSPSGFSRLRGEDITKVGGGRYYLAWLEEEEPAPFDLLRRGGPLCKGSDEKLGDGRLWHLPILRAPVMFDATGGYNVDRSLDGVSCPRSLGWDPESGEFSARPTAAYRELFDRTGEWLQMLILSGGSFEREELGGWCELAVRLLAINYRVDRVIATRLGLLDDDGWMAILNAGVNLPLLEAVDEDADEAKKKAATKTTRSGGGSARDGTSSVIAIG